ncbi:MAG TPA: glycosyltransferase family 2 protein [Microbacterium sp.]|nr:glycosyltransferase family 2 protein [Microbacterium sp.]
MGQPDERAPNRRAVTVSVVIPVKDDAQELRECLRALARQTRLADEIVVVDNGSSDASALVAAELGARLVPHPRGGIPAASAAGYDAARGDIIARMDADCLPDARWLEHIVEAFDERADVSAISGGARFAESPGWPGRVLAGLYLGGYYAVLTPTLGHVPLFGSNFAMRRSAWQAVSAEVHRDDLLVHDDLDLAFHLGRAHRIAFDRRLGMTISMRPLTEPSSYGLRVRRGFHTVFVHWPQDFPPRRWWRSYRRARAAVEPERSETLPTARASAQR